MQVKIVVDPFDDNDISSGVADYTRSRASVLTYVKGHHKVGLVQDTIAYASYLESRMAVLLLRAGIPFYPHRTIEMFDEQQQKLRFHSPDFILLEPVCFAEEDSPVSVVECKGVLKPDTFVKKRLVEEQWRLSYLIVGDLQLSFWEAYGLLPQSYL